MDNMSQPRTGLDQSNLPLWEQQYNQHLTMARLSDASPEGLEKLKQDFQQRYPMQQQPAQQLYLPTPAQQPQQPQQPTSAGIQPLPMQSQQPSFAGMSNQNTNSSQQAVGGLSFPMGQVGLTFSPNKQGGSGSSNQYNQWRFADGGSVNAQGIASLGRGQDSMLVHMTPGEVQGLQALAMRHGGSLTINPQTGLPEAGFLSSLLPMIAGIALGPAGFGVMSSAMAGLTVGGATALMTKDLGKGLMAGLGAYGGANIGSSLGTLGAGQAAQGIAETAAQPFADAVGGGWGYVPPPAAPFENMIGGAKSLFGEGAGTQWDKFIGTPADPKNKIAATGLGGKLGLAKTVGAAAAPALTNLMATAPSTLPNRMTPQSQFYSTSYNPPKWNPATGQYEPASYGPGSYGPTAVGAEGGAVGYARGGEPKYYPLTGDKVNTGGLGGRGEDPRNPRDVHGDEAGVGPRSDAAGKGSYSDEAGVGIHSNNDESTGLEAIFAKMNPTTLERYKRATNAAVQAAAVKEIYKRGRGVNPYMDDVATAAQGGLTSSDYAAGGKLLRGAGDGMSDSIPAVIRGPKPQRAALADGEFVIPADVVSHLGNGSTDAGAKRLYAMMDKVRHARTGNKKQGTQIKAERFVPA